MFHISLLFTEVNDLLFTVVVYYLRWEFMDLHRLMCDDTQLVMQLTLHKLRHLRLSQMVRNLDDILRGYLGTSMIMCTSDMCFVISALHESQRSYEIMGFVALLSVLFSYTWHTCSPQYIHQYMGKLTYSRTDLYTPTHSVTARRMLLLIFGSSNSSGTIVVVVAAAAVVVIVVVVLCS